MVVKSPPKAENKTKRHGQSRSNHAGERIGQFFDETMKQCADQINEVKAEQREKGLAKGLAKPHMHETRYVRSMDCYPA